MAIGVQSQPRQSDDLADCERSEQASKELALIQAVASRAVLLRQKSQNLTDHERQVIRQGDLALQQLLKAHRGMILNLVACYRTKGPNSGNTDLESEAILAFFDAVATYDPTKGSRLITWAYIQIRAKLQQIRRRTLHEASATILQTEPGWSEPIPEQEDREQLHWMLDQLTEKQRQIVCLHLDGWGWTEIALELESTADAARMLWRRAIQRLRRLMGEPQQRETPRPNKVDPPPAQASKNFGEPLLRQLFQNLSPRLIQIRLLNRASTTRLQRTPTRPQGLSASIPRRLSHFKYSWYWQGRAESSNSNGVRGSPSSVNLSF